MEVAQLDRDTRPDRFRRLVENRRVVAGEAQRTDAVLVTETHEERRQGFGVGVFGAVVAEYQVAVERVRGEPHMHAAVHHAIDGQLAAEPGAGPAQVVLNVDGPGEL